MKLSCILTWSHQNLDLETITTSLTRSPGAWSWLQLSGKQFANESWSLCWIKTFMEWIAYNYKCEKSSIDKGPISTRAITAQNETLKPMSQRTRTKNTHTQEYKFKRVNVYRNKPMSTKILHGYVVKSHGEVESKVENTRKLVTQVARGHCFFKPKSGETWRKHCDRCYNTQGMAYDSGLLPTDSNDTCTLAACIDLPTLQLANCDHYCRHYAALHLATRRTRDFVPQNLVLASLYSPAYCYYVYNTLVLLSVLSM